jgi:hypothetical protein
MFPSQIHFLPACSKDFLRAVPSSLGPTVTDPNPTKSPNNALQRTGRELASAFGAPTGPSLSLGALGDGHTR